MLKKHLKINETAFAVIILLVVGIAFTTYKQQEMHTPQSIQNYEMPVLNLPLRYFSDSDIRGYYGTGSLDEKNTISSAYLDGGYRSFPTTAIKLSSKDYSLDKDIMLTRFSSDDAIDVREFDVDGDGKNEMIAYTCSLGGNHCPHKIMVIKNGTIIFAVSAGLTDLELVKSETGNGFYVHWVPIEDGTKWDAPLCCSPGYISTRFVYENGKFKPVYEQEVLYFEVKNTEQQKSSKLTR